MHDPMTNTFKTENQFKYDEQNKEHREAVMKYLTRPKDSLKQPFVKLKNKEAHSSTYRVI